MATTREKKALTLRDFLALPETEPASEYIDGRVVQKVSPKTKHSVIQSRVCSRINATLNPVFHALPELRCTFGDRSLVPDISVFHLDRIPRDPSGEVANDVFDPPDVVIEIASPQQDVVTLVEKLAFCVRKGVRLGWLIDPETKKVMVLRPEQLPQELPLSGVLENADVLPGFHLAIAEMFGWLKLPEGKP